MNAAGEFERWLLNAKDAEIQNELRSLIGNDAEINERFYKELSFGTGGLRGIIRFGNMFDKISEDESLALIRYLFTWDTNELNLKYQVPRSSLAKAVQKEVANGKKFHETLRVIKKD